MDLAPALWMLAGVFIGLIMADGDVFVVYVSEPHAMRELQDFAKLSKNVVITRTDEGFDVRQEGHSMFPDGSNPVA